VSRKDVAPPGGGLALAVTPTKAGSGVEWQPAVAAGKQVYLTMWVALGQNVQIKMYGGPTGQAMVPIGSPVGSWQRYGSPGTVATTSGNFYIDVYGDQGVTFYIANTMIEEASTRGEYFDGGLTSTTSGLDVLRATAASHSGDASLQLRWRDQNQSYMYAASQLSGLQPDTDYVASLWVSIPTRLVRPITIGVDTLGGAQPQNPVTLQDATPGWVQLIFPFRTLTNSTTAALWVRDDNSYLYGSVRQSIYIDDVLVETGGAALPYFDGSTLNYVEFEHTIPLLVNGWEESADSLNVVNRVIGGGFDVTLRDASLRQGAFELVYEVDDEAEAANAFKLHQEPTTFTISDSDRPSIAMQYVVNGQITRSLDEERMYWVVRVDYQEV